MNWFTSFFVSIFMAAASIFGIHHQSVLNTIIINRSPLTASTTMPTASAPISTASAGSPPSTASSGIMTNGTTGSSVVHGPPVIAGELSVMFTQDATLGEVKSLIDSEGLSLDSASPLIFDNKPAFMVIVGYDVTKYNEGDVANDIIEKDAYSYGSNTILASVFGGNPVASLPLSWDAGLVAIAFNQNATQDEAQLLVDSIPWLNVELITSEPDLNEKRAIVNVPAGSELKWGAILAKSPLVVSYDLLRSSSRANMRMGITEPQ